MARRRVLAIGLLGGGLLVALGLTGGLTWLRSAAGNDWLGAQLVAQGNGQLVRGRLGLDLLRTDLLHGLVLQGLRLEDADGSTLLAVDSLALSFDPSALLDRRLQAITLDLDGVELHLIEEAGGQLSIAALFGPPGPDSPSAGPWEGLPGRLDLERLRLRDLDLEYRPLVGDPVRVDDIGLETHGIVEGNTVALADLALQADLRAPLALDPRLQLGAIELRGGDLHLSALQLRAGGARLTLPAGNIAAVETAPALDLGALRLEAPAALINRLAGSEALLADLRLDGALTGPLAALRFDGGLEAGPVGAAAIELLLRTEASPLGWSAVVDTHGLDVHRLIPGLDRPVHLDGRLALEGEGTSYPADLSATFRYEGRDQLLYDEPVRNLVLGGRLHHGQVQLTEASGTHPAGRLHAAGAIDLVAQTADVAAELHSPDLGALSRFGVAGVAGAAAFVGQVQAGWAGDPTVEARGELELGSLASQGFGLRRARGPVHLRYAGGAAAVEGTVTIEALTGPDLSAASLAAHVQATVRDNGAADGEVELDLAHLELGGGALHIDGVKGALHGGLRVKGAPWVDGKVDVSNITFVPTGYAVEGGPLTLSLDGGALRAEADLQRLQAPFFRGRLRADLAEGLYTVDDLVLGAVPGKSLVARGPASLRLVAGGVRDVQVDLVGTLAHLVAQGSWLPSADGVTDLHLAVSDLQLPEAVELAALFLPPDTPEADRQRLAGLRGLASADLHLLQRPGAPLEAQGGVEIAHLYVPNQVEDLGLIAHLDGPVTRPRFDLRLSGPEGLLLAAAGSAPLDLDQKRLDCAAPADLSLLLAPGDLARLHRVMPTLAVPRGEASAELRVAGPACDPDLRVIAAASLVVEPREERIRLDLEVNRVGDALQVDGAVEQDLQRRLALHGTATSHLGEILAWALQGGPQPDLDAPSTYVSALDLSVQSVDRGLSLDAVAELLDLPPGLGGQLVGGVNIAGPVEAASLSGALVWMEGRVGRVTVAPSLFGIQPAEDGDGYAVDARLDFGNKGDLFVSGHLPLHLDLTRPGGPDLGEAGLAITIGGQGLPLPALAGLVPGVESATGKLALTGEIGGTLLAPAPSLQAHLADGSLTYGPTGLSYSDLDLDLRFAANRLVIERLSLLAEPLFGLARGTRSGTLSVSGEAALVNGAPEKVELAIVADKLWLSYMNDLQVQVSANPLTVMGNYPDLHIRGDVVLDDGYVAMSEDDFLADNTLQLDPQLKVHRKAVDEEQTVVQSEGEADDLLRHIDAALKVDLSQALRLVAAYPVQSWGGAVAAQLSTVELEAQLDSPDPLEVRYRGGEIGLAGAVEVFRGDMTLMNRSFDVGNGRISFVGADYEDPILDLAAVRHTGSYGDVTARIAGSVSDMEVKFESDEYPDQTDVLSILLFDKPASELSDTEGQLGANALFAIAGNQLSKLVGSGLRGSQLEFDEGTFKAGAPVPGADRLFLGAAWDARAAEEEGNTFSLSLEWLITRRLYMEMLTGNAAVTSGDLYWRWRF